MPEMVKDRLGLFIAVGAGPSNCLQAGSDTASEVWDEDDCGSDLIGLLPSRRSAERQSLTTEGRSSLDKLSVSVTP
ncbi:MAG TPA: hypothetical protein VFY83_12655 [Anaerolineales bacterium]|nr:hypothetical protein [Anaerolineales bacterium]